MKTYLEEQCELFTRNRDKMKGNFIWENESIYPLCASLYTEKGLEVDVNKIKEGKDIIREATSLVSNFKGSIFIVLATKLALEENPREKFQRVKKLYEMLKSNFWGSQYLALTAFALEEQVAETEYEAVVKKTRRIYDKMKKEHPFLTSREDISFAALFAISEMSEDEAIQRIERGYNLLKDKFFSANAVQSLSHALAFGEEAEEVKCERLMTLFKRLKDNGCKYGTGIELATLGLLALITNDVEETVRDVLEVNRYLLNSRGFGAFGVGKVQRLMYSVLIVAQAYKKENGMMGIAFANSITSIMIAQQVVFATIMVSAVASTANN